MMRMEELRTKIEVCHKYCFPLKYSFDYMKNNMFLKHLKVFMFRLKHILF